MRVHPIIKKQMNRIISILLIVITISSMSGCYRDNEEELYPSSGSCDTTGITYSSTVASLLQSNGCVSCHSGSAPSGGILLDSYNSVRSAALNGKLYGAISHTAGFSPMPKNGNKMSACNISKIKAWITAGASNN